MGVLAEKVPVVVREQLLQQIRVLVTRLSRRQTEALRLSMIQR